ncbi:MAG: excinuclease ABC subunit UvrA [bacterium]|nr:excinuclease ABC subunit UvrA [bacterium]
MKDHICIKGARTHNLKNINVCIPRNKLTVITGLSGSGKSSLAFDTIYAEGQRRYVESLSAYARQFLDQMDKPDVDLIEGLSPAVSVEQKSSSHNPRSTVGTATEIYDYLRLLFARVGQPYCYLCGKKIEKQSVSEIVKRYLSGCQDARVNILSPVVISRKGEHAKILSQLQAQGFARIKVGNEIYDLSDNIKIDPKKKNDISVIVDRLIIKEKNRSRLFEALETSFNLSQGISRVEFLDDQRRVKFSDVLSVNNACIKCGISYPKIEPQLFSFNAPQGACAHCGGLGEIMHVDENLVIPNQEISINQGAIVPWFGKKTNYYQCLLESLAKEFKFSLDTPYNKLGKEIKEIIINGSDRFIKIKAKKHTYDGFYEGIKTNLMRRYKETESEWMRTEIVKYMNYQPCARCNGSRLKDEGLNIRIQKDNIYDYTKITTKELHDKLNELNLLKTNKEIATPIINEIQLRLGFLLDVGLNYLTLNRKSHTLSGGEAQRIKLATQIGSALVGVTYVLDEPSVGLHQKDNKQLIETLKHLRDIGNTVIVVEHDEETIKAADYVVDLGPRAGVHGGNIVFNGTPAQLGKQKNSITAQYITHKKEIAVPKTRRAGSLGRIILKGARENNLKNITAIFPLGKLICVTGVSGSGKSTLINETLYPILMRKLHKSKVRCGLYDSLEGFEEIDKIISIDQSPIGRTPRSNPATYTGLFAYIRDLFSALPESKARGYKPGRFSFNVKGGRCDHCDGDGLIRIEMHFLPDVFVKCQICQGKRFNSETLSVAYKGKNISDVLNMTVEKASDFFKNVPSIKRKTDTLMRVGLGYITLGQAATTLSGGEAQRIKLSRELSKRSTGRTLYILDEPTTGLHFEDIKMLMEVVDELVDKGNTVIVIEHNLHVIKLADHIIDLGPDGGNDGGKIVVQGAPEEIIKSKQSHTAKHLKDLL